MSGKAPSENGPFVITTKENEFDYLPIAPGQYAIETGFQKLKRKCLENPFIPIGLLTTTGILCNGVLQMARGDSVKSQKMMRMRVLAQGCTVIALLGGIVYQAKKKQWSKTDINN